MNISQGVWEQYDGQLILWTPYWAADDPDGGTGQNCGVVGLRTDGYAGKWASAPCTEISQNIHLLIRGVVKKRIFYGQAGRKIFESSL